MLSLKTFLKKPRFFKKDLRKRGRHSIGSSGLPLRERGCESLEDLAGPEKKKAPFRSLFRSADFVRKGSRTRMGNGNDVFGKGLMNGVGGELDYAYSLRLHPCHFAYQIHLGILDSLMLVSNFLLFFKIEFSILLYWNWNLHTADFSTSGFVSPVKTTGNCYNLDFGFKINRIYFPKIFWFQYQWYDFFRKTESSLSKKYVSN